MVEPVETEPALVEPVETEPALVEPVETEPPVVEPVETEPALVEPVETEPPLVEPVETSRAAAPTYPSTTRRVSAGAPHTSMTMRASSGARSSGSRAAMLRPKRTAYPSQGTCSLCPSQRARPSSITSGVSDNDTSVATRSPTDSPSVATGPTSSTTPISIPPEPVTGFCIFPRVATMSSTARRTASPSPACAARSWRKEAASRLSRSTRIRVSSGHSSRRVSRRSAACGSTPAGASTRCIPTGSPGRVCCAPVTGRNLLGTSMGSKSYGVHVDMPKNLPLAWQKRAGVDKHAPEEAPHDRQHPDRERAPPAVRVPAYRAGRARLDPLPRMGRRHREPSGARRSGSARTA